MKTISHSARVDASAETVWGMITDIENCAEIFSEVVATETLSEGPYEVGFRWTETRMVFGKPVASTMEVIECELEGRTRIRFYTEGITNYITISLGPIDEDTTSVKYEHDSEVGDVSGFKRLALQAARKASGTFMSKAMNKMVATDLDEIATESRRRSAAAAS